MPSGTIKSACKKALLYFCQEIVFLNLGFFLPIENYLEKVFFYSIFSL